MKSAILSVTAAAVVSGQSTRGDSTVYRSTSSDFSPRVVGTGSPRTYPRTTAAYAPATPMAGTAMYAQREVAYVPPTTNYVQTAMYQSPPVPAAHSAFDLDAAWKAALAKFNLEYQVTAPAVNYNPVPSTMMYETPAYVAPASAYDWNTDYNWNPTPEPIPSPYTTYMYDQPTYDMLKPEVYVNPPMGNANYDWATVADPYANWATVADPYANWATVADPNANWATVADPNANWATVADPYANWATVADPYANWATAADPYANWNVAPMMYDGAWDMQGLLEPEIYVNPPMGNANYDWAKVADPYVNWNVAPMMNDGVWDPAAIYGDCFAAGLC